MRLDKAYPKKVSKMLRGAWEFWEALGGPWEGWGGSWPLWRLGGLWEGSGFMVWQTGTSTGPEENSSRYLASRGCYSTPGCGKAGERAGSTCAIISAAHRRWAAYAMSLGFRVFWPFSGSLFRNLI